MIDWLLGLFPQVSELRSDCVKLRDALNETTLEKLRLQDRLDAAVEDRHKLWAMTTEAISNERTAYQMGINVQWQRQGFGSPYPDAPKLPSAVVPQPGGTSGRSMPEMPSSAVRRATSEFLQEYVGGK
jgi:hypothetical protein